jgi:hypothetical protein
MTIIAVKGGVMVADSASFQGGVMFPCPVPKIVAVSHGLIGASGATGDCAMLRQWALDGMDFDRRPRFSYGDVSADESVLWVWLKPDGTVHMGDCTLNTWLVPQPIAIGMGVEYLYGLLDGGMEIAAAVARTVARIAYLGGPVQVETIQPAPAS